MKILGQILMRVFGARSGGLGMLQTVLAQGGIVAVNVATGVITARLLGPAGRGEFAAASMWFLLPSQLATVGLQSAIIYRTRFDPAQSASVSGAGLMIGLGLFAPSAVLCIVLLPSLLHAYNAAIVALAQAAVLAAFLNVWMLLARQSLLGTRNVHLFNLSSAGSSVAYLLALLLVLPLHALDPAIALYCQFAATAAVLVPTLWWATRHWRWREVRPFAQLGALIRYSGQAAGVDLVTVFYWSIDRAVLVGLIAPAEFGLYAVARSFAGLVGVLQAGFSSVMLADLAHKPAREIEIYVHRTLRLLLWPLVAACIAGWLLGDVLMRLIYGDGFAPAVPIFRLLLVEAAISCLAQVLVEAFLASGRPSYASTVQGAYSVVLLGALLLLAPPLGGLGAALAILGAMLGKLLMLLLGLRTISIGFPGLLLRQDDIGSILRLLRGRPMPSPTD